MKKTKMRFRLRFRYPGGKAKKAKWILSKYTSQAPASYCEPFVGGGSVLLEAAQRWPDAKLFVSDLHPEVIAFWGLLGAGRAAELCAVLRPLDLAFFWECVSYSGDDPILQARRFLVIMKGTFNGYLHAKQPSPVGGKKQDKKWESGPRKGEPMNVDWCWKLEKIREEILALESLLNGRLVAKCMSVFDVDLTQYDVIYADPPYLSEEAKKLYGPFGTIDHSRLASVFTSLPSNVEWFMSYNDCLQVRDLYEGCSFVELLVPSSRGGAPKGKGAQVKKPELLISRKPYYTLAEVFGPMQGLNVPSIDAVFGADAHLVREVRDMVVSLERVLRTHAEKNCADYPDLWQAQIEGVRAEMNNPKWNPGKLTMKPLLRMLSPHKGNNKAINLLPYYPRQYEICCAIRNAIDHGEWEKLVEMGGARWAYDWICSLKGLVDMCVTGGGIASAILSFKGPCIWPWPELEGPR